MPFDIPVLVKNANGFPDFNPMQQKALETGLFEKSVVVAAPTASGKTVLAELCALDSILLRREKAVYVGPLRALASEHYSDFKRKYANLKIRVALSTGDLDSVSAYLENYDFIFSTNEKLDSLIRHRAEWLQSVGLLIVDEIHLLGSDRGPTLEIVIAKMKLVNPNLRILALSATIPNAEQIAEWLKARLVKSDYRPVKLEEGVFFDSEIKFEKRMEAIDSKHRDALSQLVEDTLHQKEKQCLVFLNSRKTSQSSAEKLSRITDSKLSAKEKTVLEKVSERIASVLEQPTSQCLELAELVKKGAAFHNAGLLEKQRHLVEEAFKRNYLKIICATPTLSMGINVPAFRVIIPSLYRYDGGSSQRISVSEYKQLCGRAGRPQYQESGEGVLIANSEIEVDDLMESYVRGEIEEIESKLSIEPVLRTHLLAAIATDFIFDLQSLEDFFSKTFYAFQFNSLFGKKAGEKPFGKTNALFSQLTRILQELEELGFVESNEKRFKATALGKRVAELYLDPLAAHEMIQTLKQRRAFFPLTYLFLFAQTGELHPLVSVPRKKEPEVLEELMESAPELPLNVEREIFSDDSLPRKFFTARMLEEWVSEKPDSLLSEEFNIAPGLLRSKLLVCDWLSYAAFELCKLLQLDHHLERIGKLRLRLKHGVREELLNLVEVRGIGRVRARRLWNSNIRSVSELKKTDLVDLSRVLGSEKVAFQIKQNLGQSKKPTRGSLALS
jgi:helicase